MRIVLFRSPRLIAAASAATTATVLLLSSCAGQASEDAARSAPATSPPSGSSSSSGPISPQSPSQPSPPRSRLSSSAAAFNVYAGAGSGKLSTTAKRAKSLVYVPNTTANTVQVIDPTTFRVIATYPTGREPQHVVPSWDMKTLWVNDDIGNDLVPIDPTTGKPGRRVPVEDPYNLYFTPDGTHALVMAERLRRIDVRNARTMAVERSLPVPCYGINHADFSADMSFFLASCEFSGKLLVIDREATKVIKVIDLNATSTPRATSPHEAMLIGGPKSNLRPGASAMPQDVRLTPDGNRFLVADMLRNGIWVIRTSDQSIERFIATGKGAHGIYPDRAGKRIFVTNRDQGSISVLDASSLTVTATWTIPGGSPDMGGVTPDGSQLWLSGRYHNEVYVLDTTTGAMIKRIAVNGGPHGLLVWPQPGSFSLGHTGNVR